MRCVSCGFVRAALVAAFVAGVAAVTIPSAGAAALAPAEARALASSIASAPAPAGLRMVWHEGSDDPASTLDRLARSGLRVEIALPPHLFYVRESSRRTTTLPAGFLWRDAAGATAAAASGGDSDLDLFGGRDDIMAPLPRSGTRDGVARSASFQGMPFGARWRDTSEFMIGRVGIGILFPESDGSTDPNRYDWTPTLRDSVVRSTIRALAHWTAFAARRSIPLTFAIEVHPGLATRYEPIDRMASEEDSWIQDVLTGYLGYKSDATTLAYDAANGVRSRLGASWGALLFAVQDDSSSTGQFADGAISHARLGGPYFVTPVKNGGSALQGATLDTYIEHELAHMFWALDEHLPSTGWWACSLKTGYLNVQNSNSLVPAAGYCGTPPVQCLMKGNYPDGLCIFTEGQVGWADTDQNGVPDLIDTHPAVFPDSDNVSALAGASIHLHGHALEIPLGNLNPNEFFAGDSISIATIDSVRYSINGGPMLPVPAEDGAYDSGREYFTLTLPPFAAGTYTVDWEAWNSNVRKSVNNRSTTITVRNPTSPVGMGGDRPEVPRTALRVGPTPSAGTVRFTLRARPGSLGWGTIHDVRGSLVTRWRLVVPASGIADWNWSARVGGGPLPSGLYFLTLDIDGARIQRRLVISH